MKVSKITKFLHEKCPLGIDLDNKNWFKLLKVYFNAKYIFKGKKVEVFETKHGYHVIVHVPTNLYHRIGLGDDPNRIYLSEIRGRFEMADDVTFEIKNKFRREEINPLAEPFWYPVGRPLKGRRLRRRCRYELERVLFRKVKKNKGWEFETECSVF